MENRTLLAFFTKEASPKKRGFPETEDKIPHAYGLGELVVLKCL